MSDALPCPICGGVEGCDHTVSERLRAENAKLRAECEAWRECAKYDVLMEGPRPMGWNRSALERCRKKYIDEIRAALEETRND